MIIDEDVLRPEPLDQVVEVEIAAMAPAGSPTMRQQLHMQLLQLPEQADLDRSARIRPGRSWHQNPTLGAGVVSPLKGNPAVWAGYRNETVASQSDMRGVSGAARAHGGVTVIPRVQAHGGGTFGRLCDPHRPSCALATLCSNRSGKPPPSHSASPHVISSGEATLGRQPFSRSTVDRIFRPAYKKLPRVSFLGNKRAKQPRRTGGCSRRPRTRRRVHRFRRHCAI